MRAVAFKGCGLARAILWVQALMACELVSASPDKIKRTSSGIHLIQPPEGEAAHLMSL